MHEVPAMIFGKKAHKITKESHFWVMFIIFYSVIIFIGT